MALRLRRGTDAERLTITPLEGELIYTTDTEKLFIGDGSTAGGNPVITDELADLTDVDLTGLANGQTIAYNLGNVRFEPANLPSTIDDLTDVDTTGIVAGNILKWDGASFIPSNEGGLTQGATYNINVDGDLTGSVFGDDSSVIVDGLDGSIHTGNISTPRLRIDNVDQPGDGLNGGIGEVNLDIASNDNRSLLNLRRVSETDLTGDISAIYGTVTFGREDVNGTLTTNIFFGRENGMYFGNTPTGVFNDGSYFMVWRDNKLGVGTATPAEALDVNGNGVFTGNVEAASFVGSVATDDSSIIINGIDGSINAQSFVQFGSLTTAERDALTAANGMVIYNTTNNKFEGYQNGGWINLDDGLAAS